MYDVSVAGKISALINWSLWTSQQAQVMNPSRYMVGGDPVDLPLLCRIMEPVKVSRDDLEEFHSGDYVSFLKAHNAQEWDDLSPEEMEEAEAWGLGMYLYQSIKLNHSRAQTRFKYTS